MLNDDQKTPYAAQAGRPAVRCTGAAEHRRQSILEPKMKTLITAIVLTLGVATAAHADPNTFYDFPDGFFEQLDEEGPRHSALPEILVSETRSE